MKSFLPLKNFGMDFRFFAQYMIFDVRTEIRHTLVHMLTKQFFLNTLL